MCLNDKTREHVGFSSGNPLEQLRDGLDRGDCTSEAFGATM